MTGPRYIYFAGDNLFGTKYYRKAVIIGETGDLVHRQCMYGPGKGFVMPQTGDLVSYTGAKGLMWPFMAYFEAPPGVTDKFLHELLAKRRPFTDFVYPIKDRLCFHSKEGFGFWHNEPLEDAVARLKRFIEEYLVSG